MAPPVRQSQSWAGAPAVCPAAKRPEVLPSSETMAPSGSRAPTIWHTASAVSGTGGQLGADGGLDGGGVGGRARPRRPARPARAPGRRRGPASTWTVQPSGTRSLALLGVGEERHRRLGVDEDQVAEAVELHGGELGQVGEPVDRHAAGAALEAGRERLGEELGAGGVGDAAGVDEGVGPAGPAADEQARPARRPGGSRPARRPRRGSTGVGGGRRGGGRRARRRRTSSRRPAG